MIKFQLFLDTSNEELFRKATSELGTIFYQITSKDANEALVVYFSGSRVAKLQTRISEEYLKHLKVVGFEALKLDVDEATGFVNVVTR